MDGRGTLLILGASARAAAFSALRAGFQPWCADLFADADLQQRAPAMRLPGPYPEGFFDLIDVELSGPWMYTGGLENRPGLVGKMAGRRPLWGNGRTALLQARSPFTVAGILRSAGLAGPEVWGPGSRFPCVPRWLVKPVAGGGGSGIRYLDLDAIVAATHLAGCYLQEFLEGESRSAVFTGDGRSARLLGMTRQLVGCPWLHAKPFQYCGSIGPLPLSASESAALARIGNVLAAECRLRGLFGVDGIWRRGTLWPVEVNPRYTASVEVIEYATGTRALSGHALVFESGALPPAPASASGLVGKAVLFARESISFPAKGRWSVVLDSLLPVEEMPPFADIPPAEATIDAGDPVLTIFARAATMDACEAALQDMAGRLDRELFPP